jgi:uncharacterized protein DUF1990
MHRREVYDGDPSAHLPPPIADGIDRNEIVGAQGGYGPLVRRRYRTLIRDADVSAETLLEMIASDPNRAAPTKFARFQKVFGDTGVLAAGDEFVVRMPGPWDGPVRVVDASAASFRLATLEGHLEAGQIEFRVHGDDPIEFEIESWARSADRLADLLYHRVRMAKEVQVHMWISFLEGVVKVAGGRMTGGVEIDTRLIEDPFSG